VELNGKEVSCQVGHSFSTEELQEEFGREAFNALLSAVRALEDWTAGAQWLLSQPLPPPHLRLEVDQALRQAGILRELIEARRPTSPQASLADDDSSESHARRIDGAILQPAEGGD
jgi:hypothetical protein